MDQATMTASLNNEALEWNAQYRFNRMKVGVGPLSFTMMVNRPEDGETYACKNGGGSGGGEYIREPF